MARQTTTLTHQQTPTTSTLSSGILQRKCASCGQHTISGEECEECQKQYSSLKYRFTPQALLPGGAPDEQENCQSTDQLLNPLPLGFTVTPIYPDFSRVPVRAIVSQKVQPRLSSPLPEAHQAAKLALQTPESLLPLARSRIPLTIQKFPAESSSTANPSSIAPPTGISPTTATLNEVSTPGLIVEDTTENLRPEQMRKSEFLSQLRIAACAAAEEALTGTPLSTMGCPYIEHWFSYYQNHDSRHVERALRRYAPEAITATTAREYIPIVREQVRRSVQAWVETGEITGVPEEMLLDLPGAGLMSTLAELNAGITSAASGLVSDIGSLLFKERGSGAREVGDPRTIQAQLGAGQPLDSRVKSRMEGAFRYDFSQVRVHTDAKAVALSEQLNARAFTVGRDVTFASGEYQPGTLIGDALLAHELAHVVQQGSASASGKLLLQGSPESNALEEDADWAAVGAVASLWDLGKLGMKQLKREAMPQLRSGLRLQRCSSCRSQVQLRNPRQLQQQYDTIRAEILRNVPRGIARAAEIEIELDLTLSHIWNAYETDLRQAGSDRGQQAQAQQRLTERLQTIRQSSGLLVQMMRRYNVLFTAGFTHIRERSTTRYDVGIWSRQELAQIDAVLQRVPTQYLHNIRKIKREPRASQATGESASVPADWEQLTGTITIYNRFFSRPEHERTRFLLHEIGHSTYQSQQPSVAGGFAHLPPQAWMNASGWQTATLANLGDRLGIRDESRVSQIVAQLQGNKQNHGNRPVPIDVGYWKVVYDKYESGNNPTRFFYYPSNRDREFVSDYARTHPAEDLAESFAYYLYDPRILPIQVMARDRLRGPKLNYLRQHYPHQLRSPVRRKAKNSHSLTVAETIQLQPQTPIGRPSAIPAGGHDSEVPSEGIALPSLIVDDNIRELRSGQMRKSQFLAELRAAVCSAAEAALADTDQTTEGCPYLDRWFSYYREQDSRHVELAVRRYAPDAARATTAAGYIPIVAERARQGVEAWVRTGEIPEGLPLDLPGMGLLETFSNLATGITGIGTNIVQGMENLLFKQQSGYAGVGDPRAIQTQLESGQSLDSRVKARMEGVFRYDFSQVRVHTDARAAGLSDQLNARAFTVGRDVAFASGEYQPGTLIGDALIAHELAHVVQQGGGTASGQLLPQGTSDSSVLEEDADWAAVAAVASLWDLGKLGVKQFKREAMPQLRSGLRLQRCASCRSQTRQRARTVADFAAMTPWQLSRVSEEEFAQAEAGQQPTSEPRIADYRRARQLARAALTFDIDSPPGPGRDPTEEELEILDRNLSQLLASGNIQALVSGQGGRGGRGLPTSGSGSTRTLRGRVRIATRAGFAAARYRLQLTVVGISQNTSQIDARVAQLWQQHRITASPSARVTEQERRLAMYNIFLQQPWVVGLANGLYQVREDRVYIPEIVNLSTSRGSFLARHETAHLIGGGERLREAFVRRFGTNWLEWWNPFNEGMAELIARESLPSGQTPPPPAQIRLSETLTISEERYNQYVIWMQNIARNRQDRELIFRAYFTGNVPEGVFELLARQRGVPLPPLPRR